MKLSDSVPFCAEMNRRITKSRKKAFSIGNTFENKSKKYICTGIVAHVDAGKITLSEVLLFKSGVICNMGKVDFKNTILDNYEAKQNYHFFKAGAVYSRDTQVTLLDTLGACGFCYKHEEIIKQDFIVDGNVPIYEF